MDVSGVAAFLIVWLSGVPVEGAGTAAGIGFVVTVALVYFCEHELLGLAAWDRLPGQPLATDVIALGWPVATPLVLGLWLGSW